MSNGSSATNWVVGCLAAAVVCILICGGVAVWLVSSGFREARQAAQRAMQQARQAEMEMAREQEEMLRQEQLVQEASNWTFPEGWTAPETDALSEALLPLQVGAWERMFQSTEPEIPAVNIPREAQSAVYATNGRSLDVYVCPVSAEDRDTLFNQAEQAVNTSGIVGQSVMSSDDDEMRTLLHRPQDGRQTTWLVWNDGWLFSFQAADANTPIADFMSEYFRAIDAGGTPAEPADTDANPEANDPDSAAQPVEDDQTAEAPTP